MIEKSLNAEILNTYIYGADNRLKNASNNKGEQASYSYNGLGRRVSRRADNTEIEYILDQTKMYNNLLEADGDSFVWDENNLLFRNHETEIRDRLGSPIDMGEFGTETAASTLGFTGYMYDDISGTYFAQAREYMPEIGRFAGRDIIKGEVEVPRSLNEYAYCHNNPMGYVDLNGMFEMNMDEFANGSVRGSAENVGMEITERAGRKAGRIISRKTITARTDFATEFAKRVQNPSMGTRTLTNIQKGISPKTGSYRTFVGKAGTAGKYVGGGLTIALEVGIGYMEDTAANKSIGKITSNAGVNAGYAVVGLGVSAMATPFVASGLVTLGIASGPAGWIALAIVGAAWGAWTAISSGTVKDWINSLE